MFSKILKKITDIIIVLLIIFLGIYFILRIMGIAEIYLVKTGSMEDGIHVGDYILIYRKDEYKIGDIVTYEKDGYHVTHRIIKKNGDKIVTKGDANNVEDDEINVKNIVGKVIYSGGYLNFIIDYKYALASALLALYLFSCYFSKKDDEINEDNFLLETNKGDDALKNDILSEEVAGEEIIKDDDSSEINDKKEIIEDVQTEEETAENEAKKNEYNFLSETNKENDVLKNDILSEEITEEGIIKDDDSSEINDKKEIIEDVQTEEKTDEKIKQDLSFIYEGDLQQENKKAKKKKGN